MLLLVLMLLLNIACVTLPQVVPWKHKDFGHKNMAYFTGAVFGDQGQELKDVL